MDTITLQGIPCFGYHGCLPEERQNGQPFIVDIILQVSLKKACESDDLHDTIDYSNVYALVKKVTEGTPYQLVERLAGVLAESLLTQYPAEAVTVTVHKPQAPVGGAIGDVAVTITRRR